MPVKASMTKSQYYLHTLVHNTIASLRKETGGGHCERSYKLLGSIKCREFLDFLETGQLLKKDSAPWSKI